jgi:hypothetical protein
MKLSFIFLYSFEFFLAVFQVVRSQSVIRDDPTIVRTASRNATATATITPNSTVQNTEKGSFGSSENQAISLGAVLGIAFCLVVVVVAFCCVLARYEQFYKQKLESSRKTNLPVVASRSPTQRNDNRMKQTSIGTRDSFLWVLGSQARNQETRVSSNNHGDLTSTRSVTIV